MEKEKLLEFDFKKHLPTVNSKAEQKISKIVTKKFLAIVFIISLGVGVGYNMASMYDQQYSIEKQMEYHNQFLKAQQNKDMIISNLEKQVTMYDDMIKDILIANNKVTNSAKTTVQQASQIRSDSQNYKIGIIKVINNFNEITQSEDIFNKSSSSKKQLLIETLDDYQAGNLRRSIKLENTLMRYTTIDDDEEEFVKTNKPIREELKKQIIEKMNQLLGDNDITKTKKLLKK